MNDGMAGERKDGFEIEYELDALPQKVWRAISIAEFRESWLPKDALAAAEATSVTPGQEVSYRMRDNAPPFLESTVTFRIAPNAAGGTSLRIIHELTDVRFGCATRAAANSNGPPFMLAA
ncbi:SRPBCC domain-containing protein [Rhizobium puerariae]|uniref:SRPBCC domain-containing protein n=1 Tax=Rhizobium puerariae TaxID=1585791 RepID=A0ABV6AMS9_9HYPH